MSGGWHESRVVDMLSVALHAHVSVSMAPGSLHPTPGFEHPTSGVPLGTHDLSPAF